MLLPCNLHPGIDLALLGGGGFAFDVRHNKGRDNCRKQYGYCLYNRCNIHSGSPFLYGRPFLQKIMFLQAFFVIVLYVLNRQNCTVIGIFRVFFAIRFVCVNLG